VLLIVHALGEAGNWQKAKDSGKVALPYTHRNNRLSKWQTSELPDSQNIQVKY
jgi:hypothetical protein